MAVDRFAYQRELDTIIRAYRDAQTELQSQIDRALREGNLGTLRARRAVLAQVTYLLDRLGQETDPIVRDLVGEAFMQSADRTGATITRAGLNVPVSADFTRVSSEAIATVQDSMLTSLQGARVTVGRQAADVFAQAGRRETLVNLLGSRGSGKASAKALEQRLRDKGVSAFTDKGGRVWNLQDYSRMVMRTNTRQAVVQGALTRMSAQGVNIGQISVDENPCPICEQWQGQLFSIDGSVEEYQGEAVLTLDEMDGGPPFHPSCEHTVLPVVGDVGA
jgi:hypothetical protein